MLPNSLSSPSITCKYYTTPAYHLPMAFLSCPAPHLEAPSLLLYPIDAGLFPSAFYYATAHFTSERGLHVSVVLQSSISSSSNFPSPLTLPLTHSPSSFQPTPLFSATSALTTRPLLAEARMLTALSIEQYSFSTFTTLLYRPPCGGIALDVYNYS